MSNLITEISTLASILEQQRAAFSAQPYPDYKDRIDKLKRLKNLVLQNQGALVQSLCQDFGHRSNDDSLIGDILTSVSGINYSIDRLKKWMKPKRKHIGILFQPASGHVMHQPLGIIGIIVPWNYPLFLSLGPLTTALAAGNRAMLKMSEFTPNTNELLAKLIAQEFPLDEVAVIGGEADMAAAFSSLSFDHLFFTGSTQVGKLVMQAAAKNLVPVTLELGGKSPAIIADDVPIKTAVERFIFGKTLNCGQTCVAPDYLFCPEGKQQALIDEIRLRFNTMFPTVQTNDDYTNIVNQRQYERIQGLLEDAKEKGANIIPLVQENIETSKRKIPLTVVTNVNDNMKIMQEEIFGPLLPIKEYKDMSEVIAYVSANPRPLSLYIYSFDKDLQTRILKETIAGGVCINDAAFHVANEDLPFGGVGASGMGNYHGEEGFVRFSHAKSILKRGKLSFAHLLFPPYGKAVHKLVYKLFIR
ncbi:coniferyl aldehyde dehydrogenase [Glaciecola sp. MF2-115]|uniref:coniferyl aldehyde dehydrogenase n=1 Tax=Glaciecola sp. MF2-115 TaxID=3384827 RepID=UPI0039A2F001